MISCLDEHTFFLKCVSLSLQLNYFEFSRDISNKHGSSNWICFILKVYFKVETWG